MQNHYMQLLAQLLLYPLVAGFSCVTPSPRHGHREDSDISEFNMVQTAVV